MARNCSLLVCTMTSVFTILPMANASQTLLFEDFEDTSGFTASGNAVYWGIASLNGTPSYPSQFAQGGSQSGNIFYGVNGYDSTATMTIILPDLTGYTDLEMTVALAAAEGVWESTHRDSLLVKGTTGTIDSFLPPARPSSLRSQVHSTDLVSEFQDFGYVVNSTLESLTFNFASTGNNEVVGIDSVRITGDPLVQTVSLDIKPGSDPNSINPKSKGVLPVAVLSTDDFDALSVDPETLLFGDPLIIDDGDFLGVRPIRHSEEDVSDDGLLDLSLKFSVREMFGSGVFDTSSDMGRLTGSTFGGVDIVGTDSIRIVPTESSAKAVPEPSIILLAAIGLVVLLSVGGQRRR